MAQSQHHGQKSSASPAAMSAREYDLQAKTTPKSRCTARGEHAKARAGGGSVSWVLSQGKGEEGRGSREVWKER